MKVIEKSYARFLKLMNLDESIMGDHERKERKRTFYAGFGSAMVDIPDVVNADTDEGQLLQIIELQAEVQEFFDIECLIEEE